MTFKSFTMRTLTSGAALAMLMTSTAFAQGGSDPIPGIDIIIKSDPGSQPIQPGRFGEKDIGLTYDADVEKLSGTLYRLTGQTLKANKMRGELPKGEIISAAKALSAQIKEGDAGASSFTYPSADGRSKITVTFRVRGDGEDRLEENVTLNFPTKSMTNTSTPTAAPTPKSMQMDADTYGSSRSNRGSGAGLAGPEIGTPNPDTSTPAPKALQMDAETYGNTRSNRSSAISGPAGCVMESGAVDANCDGVADAATKAK